MPADPSIDARVARLEGDNTELRADLRELKTDIRSLTGSVSELAKTVAVLSERLTHLAIVRHAEPASGAPAPDSSKAQVLFAGSVGGALGAGIVAGLLKALGVPVIPGP